MHTLFSKKAFVSISLASLLLLPVTANATQTVNNENIDELAKSLMQLRQDVEILDESIQDKKDTQKAKMKSLVMQKSELEATIAREDLKIKQIEKELNKVKAQIKDASKNSQGLKPLILNAITLLEANIDNAIPFKTKERRADLQRTKMQLEQNLITPQKALVLVWNSFDDAIRMSKENGIFKQSIMIDGKPRLAEVARLGTIMMFFKTPDERVGYVVKNKETSKNTWDYVEVINKEKKAQVLTLFDAFKKQIRTGYFTLPNAIATAN
jgi:hypothetical protein